MSAHSTAVPSRDVSIERKTDADVEQGVVEKPAKDDASGEPETISPYHPSQFPDGGRDAWLCLLGSFCCLFVSFGWLNCVGVFQSYYQANQLRDYSPSTVAWISSCEIFVMFFPGPIVGFFYDNHGPLYLLLFGTFMHVFGIMMTSLCTEYWQFILAQGICSPLGLNAIFNAATSSVTQWFFKKRGAAFGMMAAGSGLGGIIFPIMASHLIPRVGFGWAMRICAFLILFLCIVAIFTIRARLAPRIRKFELRVFWEPFTETPFILMVISCFLFFLALFVPINFIEVQALAGGMSQHLASYLIPILNAASIFGRIIPGILADKVGRFNIQVIMCFFSAILVLALAYNATNNAAFITFAAFYGFASGAFVSITPAQIAFITKVEQIGVRTGVLFSAISLAGLAGSPIAGQIALHGFKHVHIFVGCMLLAGASMFTVTRFYIAKWKLAAKV